MNADRFDLLIRFYRFVNDQIIICYEIESEKQLRIDEVEPNFKNYVRDICGDSEYEVKSIQFQQSMANHRIIMSAFIEYAL
jgi:uncharacterized membrane protein